ncbi:MAG: RagB/SusD family nutrient uptake outer membrane protein [Tannerella sp.]|nr:RagB/SusD family nutrient uptake outer membrane protein [Tannerella sp.]
MKNRIKKMTIRLTGLIACILLWASCGDYLDIVPDNVPQYNDLFVSRKQANNALAQLYSGLNLDRRDATYDMIGDEWVTATTRMDEVRGFAQGVAIMVGQQAVSDPLTDFWTGGHAKKSLWIPIRDCDLFVGNVDLIPDMSSEDKADWKAQARFMKAYYLFLLLQEYGPIILPVTVMPDAPSETMFLPRRKVEDCFDYIVGLMDEAIPDLKERAGFSDLGQVDKVSAKAIKARVLLFRASPFYNGNSEYYAGFLDHDGQPFFSQTYDPEKWKIALDAVNDAILSCEQNKLGLYHYRGQPYGFDREDWIANPVKMQTLYDLRMQIADPWNEEIIWGWNDPDYLTDGTLSYCSMLWKPAGYGGPGAVNSGGSGLAATYQSMERFYTEHGLPLDEDRTVNPNTLHEIVMTPSEINPEYASVRGLLQPAVSTVRMYLNREPRFYAHMAFTGGYYRAHQVRINAMLFAGAECGYQAQQGNWPNHTGIGVQKIIHPETIVGNRKSEWIYYPIPIIRVADLYLMKAEAMNEYYGPSPEVYDALNAIRTRAGIPPVEVSYTNSEWVSGEALNKHLTQEGLREIIRRDRTNELAYEFGVNFWDRIRWKIAVTEYSRPIWGWNYLGATPASFFILQNVQGRKWSITDCLWPIKTSEMNANANLIQNPGW